MPDPTRAVDVPAADVPAADAGDRLLLAFAELAMYGITAEEVAGTDPDRARTELGAQVRRGAPHGLGSYVFRLRPGAERPDAERSDAERPDAGGALALYTSGPEVDRAVVAACAHQGLEVRPGGPAGVLVARVRPA